MSTITLKKIAQSLNLSISTVSRALKDHPDIGKETIRKIKEVAEALDYEPNANAIHLKKQDSRLFAVLIPNLSNFYSSFISGLEEECRKENYNVMILQSGDDAEIEKLNLKLCRHNRVTGVFVCMCTNSHEYNNYDRLIQNEIPILFFDKVPTSNEYHKISISDEHSAELAANWINKNSNKKVLALFGNPQLSITKRRLESFTKKIDKKKMKINIEYASSTKEAEDIATRYIENEEIDSIFCMSDEILIGSMNAKQKKRSRRTIDVLTMSDGFFPNLYQPNIKYVETSGYKLAKKAFVVMKNIIVERIQPSEYFVEPVLI